MAERTTTSAARRPKHGDIPQHPFHEAPLTSKEAIRRGIAPDGGLYVSDELGCTQIPLAGLSEMGYLNLAREVLAALLTDYAPEEIAACVSEAYEETLPMPKSRP